jgi:rhodanese-related sulfurtransferase
MFGVQVKESPMETIDPKGLNDRMKGAEKMVLLDVRETDELTGEFGHLPNIVHIPLGQLPERVGELNDKNATVISICKMGGRATRAAEFLESNGFKKVIVLEGGMSGWKDAGLTTA